MNPVAIADIARAWCWVFEPPSRMTVSEWADEFRFLSPEASAYRGKYQSAATPYAREWMDSLHDPTATGTVIMVGSQLGKTEVVNNICGYFIAVEPAPMLIVQPTIDMAEDWSKNRFAPMVRDTPALHGKVKDARSRDSNNTILAKSFPGGNMAIAGANAPSGLAARPRRVVLLDEVDRFPVSAGTEGDPCALAIRRTETFWNAVIVMTSTPTIKDQSRIESEYLASDQRRYWCPCPHCGAFQTLKWAQMRWDAEDGSDARYLCDTCQAEITDEQRREMVRNGEWRAEFPERTVRGYHLNGLASLFRHKKGYTNRLHQMAAEHIAAKKKGKETLKTWVNTFLAETWEEEGETLSHETLMLRRHEWRDFPEGGLLVTAGADVQGDRVEVEFVAWGEGEESWSIGYEVIIGDFNRESVQDTLDDLLKRTWTHPSGVEIRVSAAAIDSGHKSKAVYGFCRRREMRRVFAVKGRGGPALPILSRPNRRGIEKALLFTVGTDAAKEVIFSRLLEGTAGPGYMHIPADRSEDWCRQMVAEKKVTRYRDGVPFSKFENPGKARNEALDCRVYALAALSMLRVNWDRLKASFDKSAAARKAEAQSAAKEPPAAGAIKRSRPPRGGWVQNW